MIWAGGETEIINGDPENCHRTWLYSCDIPIAIDANGRGLNINADTVAGDIGSSEGTEAHSHDRCRASEGHHDKASRHPSET